MSIVSADPKLAGRESPLLNHSHGQLVAGISGYGPNGNLGRSRHTLARTCWPVRIQEAPPWTNSKHAWLSASSSGHLARMIRTKYRCSSSDSEVKCIGTLVDYRVSERFSSLLRSSPQCHKSLLISREPSSMFSRTTKLYRGGPLSCVLKTNIVLPIQNHGLM